MHRLAQVISSFCLTMLLLAGCSSDNATNTPGDAPETPEVTENLPAYQSKFDWGTESEQTLGPLKVTVESIDMGPVQVQTAADTEPQPTPEKYLIVKVKLENVGEERKLEYIPWSSPSAAFNDLTGRLSDQNNKKYPAKIFAQDTMVPGMQTKKISLIKGEPVEDMLVFEPIASDAKVLLLELPGGAVEETESLRFQINVPEGK